MAGSAPTATPAARVDGVDAARGLALIGMFIAHVPPAVTSPKTSRRSSRSPTSARACSSRSPPAWGWVS